MAERLLEGFINSVEDKKLNVRGILVLQHGKKIAEYRWEEEVRHNQYSVSKSFMSTAIGIAINEGLLSLDDRVVDYFREEMPAHPQEELSFLTLRNLLTMSTGHGEALLMAGQREKLEEKNWIRYSLAQPLAYKPGERFVYNNASTYLAGVMLQKKAEQSLVDYLMPRLFEPLGIPRPEWETCTLGYTFGASGLQINTSELSRLGQLYLQKGAWEGRQLVPESWVKEASSKQIDTYNDGDGGYGYGYQFWRGSHNTFRADGAHGQFCIVLQELDAVITINSNEEHPQHILDSVWEEILPNI